MTVFMYFPSTKYVERRHFPFRCLWCANDFFSHLIVTDVFSFRLRAIRFRFFFLIECAMKIKSKVIGFWEEKNKFTTNRMTLSAIWEYFRFCFADESVTGKSSALSDSKRFYTKRISSSNRKTISLAKSQTCFE